jgi:predicted butyrate kinase (DUF1464 family)
MPRVVGIDPGSVSIDICGLEDGRLVLDRSWPTAEALGEPDELIRALRSMGEPDLVAGPSGYGLPLVPAERATEEDWRLAFLARPGEEGGLGGLRHLARRMIESGLRTVFLPGAIHLDTVPPHRKLNRVDLGTADKVAAAALGITDQAQRFGCPPSETSFLLLELGGAFSAALAVHGGRIVDGLGGTSGPMGWRSSGALDGEVAYLSGEVTKAMLFRGGVQTLAESGEARRALGLDALAEGAIKSLRSVLVSVPAPREILLSGRALTEMGVLERLEPSLAAVAPVRRLQGFARVAKAPAQGAAIIADGLAGGRWQPLVETMRLRHASGTVLDHLVVITPEAARRRLGLA